MRKKTNSSTASKRAHSNSTQMETSSHMGRTCRKTSRSKTSRAKNCGK
ncbi:MAG: hypothetical protein IKR12_00575 [Clostridia bacterium]|nr:hypothetical protein [Clostridia bacterium]